MDSVSQFSLLKDVYIAIAGVKAIMPALREAQQHVHEEVLKLKKTVGSDKVLQDKLIAYLYWYEENIPVASINEAFGTDLKQVRQIASKEYPNISCTQCGRQLITSDKSVRRSLVCGRCTDEEKISLPTSNVNLSNVVLDSSAFGVTTEVETSYSHGPHILMPDCSTTSYMPKRPKARRWETKQQRLEDKEALLAKSPRVLELRRMPYAEYLKTPEWQKKRRKALATSGMKCQMCSATNKSLNVHHNTYERLGYERPSDLIVLCVDCHSKHHDKLPPPPRTTLGKDDLSVSYSKGEDK